MLHVYKIAAWNANGLTPHLKEVEVFLNIQKIDILLVSETHFTRRYYIKIPNYIAYDTKHPNWRAHAGTP
jgi:exonuclease III